MITISGTLAIRTINGSRGAFNVGRLITEIGEFTVKDSLIEEYEEGRYKGSFGIVSIKPSTYHAAGRTVIEVRASLGTIDLDDVGALSREDRVQISDPDPLDSDPPAAVAAPTTPTVKKEANGNGRASSNVAAPPEADASMEELDEGLPALFGTLWPLGDRVKLDPTVDRSVFRQQRDRLKALGYSFVPVGQYWDRV